MSYGNIIVTVKCKISLVEVIVFTEATVVKTTEAAASVASNVATAMLYCLPTVAIFHGNIRTIGIGQLMQRLVQG